MYWKLKLASEDQSGWWKAKNLRGGMISDEG